MVELSKARCLDYPKFVVSALLLVFSTVCTFYAIIEQKTNFWHAVPGWAALIIFIIILFWLGLMEGLQVALVELKRVDIEQFRRNSFDLLVPVSETSVPMGMAGVPSATLAPARIQAGPARC